MWLKLAIATVCSLTILSPMDKIIIIIMDHIIIMINVVDVAKICKSQCGVC